MGEEDNGLITDHTIETQVLLANLELAPFLRGRPADMQSHAITDARTPRLLRAPGFGEMKKGTSYILRNYPCDAIWHSHAGHGITEPVARELRDHHGITLFRGFNAIHSYEAAAGWDPTRSVEAYIFHVFETGDGSRDWWLREKDTGDLVRWRYSDGRSPEDRIPNWSFVGIDAAREIARFVLDAYGRDTSRTRYLIDHCWADYRFTRWAFEERMLRLDDLADFAVTKWMHGLRSVLRELGWPGIECVTNGDRNYTAAHEESGGKGGRAFLIENADDQLYWGGIVAAVELWKAHSHSILSINGKPDAPSTRYVLEPWARGESCGMLWAERKSTADRAWELLRNARAGESPDPPTLERVSP